jgi:hypothetical protein
LISWARTIGLAQGLFNKRAVFQPRVDKRMFGVVASLRMGARTVVLVVALASSVIATGCSPAPAAPEPLSATGLFADKDSEKLAEGVRAFRPQYELYSDGATKRRWILLPDGKQIDTANMDGWKFPIGTKVWKEFTRDGVRVETRYLRKDGAGSQDWTIRAFVWNADQKDAIAAPDGKVNALGTPHDVPDTKTCKACHTGSADFLLGFSAIQLDHSLGDLDLATLASEGRLTVAPSGPYKIPGNDVERAALAYLHVNCGNCHNNRALKPALDLHFLLGVGELGSVEQTAPYKTAINTSTQVPEKLTDTAATKNIVPGDPDASLVYVRMQRRAPEKGQMPSVATEVVDPIGIELIAKWIRALPP